MLNPTLSLIMRAKVFFIADVELINYVLVRELMQNVRYT